MMRSASGVAEDAPSMSNRNKGSGADIDLQTCIDNFDVHKDKIIRTQDSRDMGAQYLNEIDLGSREECLRLCCETATCDVFIFEEKNAGSCYLFHCGPSEDFKCKFTHHDNYSSGILSIPRQQHDLERQIKLTKHEQDLSKLRKPADIITNVQQSPGQSARTYPTTISTTTKKSTEVLSDTPTRAPERVQVRKCSRYQFECRSNRECIAIYNVCDGIPQCSDGSDEAPELNCPEQAQQSTASPAIKQPQATPPPPPPRPATYMNPAVQSRPAVVNQNLVGVHQANIIYHVPPAQEANDQRPEIHQQHQQQAQHQQQQQQQQQQDFIRPGAVPQRTSLGQNERQGMYGEPEGQQYPNSGQVVSDSWVPHQSNQLQSMQSYVDKNSHIFNHKESGLQVPEAPEGSSGQYGEAREYPKLQNYYGEMYRQQMQEQWPVRTGDVQNNPYIVPSNRVENWPTHQLQNVNEPAVPIPKLPTIEHTIQDTEKMVHDLKHSSVTDNKDNSDEIVVKHREKIIQAHQHGHDHGHGGISSEYKMAQVTDLQDGETESPGGAVLSLTLGVLLTCVMGTLIGCRLRVVHRRMRRGGKSPYAHDADYLVNGMYL